MAIRLLNNLNIANRKPFFESAIAFIVYVRDSGGCGG